MRLHHAEYNILVHHKIVAFGFLALAVMSIVDMPPQFMAMANIVINMVWLGDPPR